MSANTTQNINNENGEENSSIPNKKPKKELTFNNEKNYYDESVQTIQKMPLEEIPWNSLGILLNVDNVKLHPTGIINKVRELFQKLINKVEETLTLKESPSLTSLWLKRLELIPIVLFTIRLPTAARIKEIKKRIDFMDANQWNKITFKMVYKPKQLKEVSNYFMKKAEELLEQGLVSKSFQKLQAKDTLQRLKVTAEIIEKIKKLNPERNSPFLKSWLNDEEIPIMETITATQ